MQSHAVDEDRPTDLEGRQRPTLVLAPGPVGLDPRQQGPARQNGIAEDAGAFGRLGLGIGGDDRGDRSVASGHGHPPAGLEHHATFGMSGVIRTRSGRPTM
jgi:hypothetical protein